MIYLYDCIILIVRARLYYIGFKKHKCYIYIYIYIYVCVCVNVNILGKI